MKELKYDVVIVGAGPAGSVTAKHAALNGASTLFIEKRQEVGTPVRCGEGLDKKGVEKMGIKFDKSWVAWEVAGAHIVAPDGTRLELTEEQAGSEVGYVVYRDIFDKALAKEAVEAGADLLVKTSAVELLQEGGKSTGIVATSSGKTLKIQADIVVGADGYESQVGRWAGIDTSLKPKDIFTCLQYHMVDIDINSEVSHFHLGKCAPGGYAWIFPKGEDEANVGLGIQLSKIRPGEVGVVKKYLDKFVADTPGLAKGKSISNIAGAVSISLPVECSVLNGFMLVGDSARMIDPITGGGIIHAGQAGRIAGKLAAEAVESGNTSKEFLMAYDRGWRKLFEDKLYRNYMAKEKVVTFNDEMFNKVIGAVVDAKLSEISTLELFKAIQQKFPELVAEFEDMLI